MPYYYVNTNAQTNGDHEVHEVDVCPHPAASSNRKGLGYHASCKGAVDEAKKTYPTTANGCYYCCEPCHTT